MSASGVVCSWGGFSSFASFKHVRTHWKWIGLHVFIFSYRSIPFQQLLSKSAEDTDVRTCCYHRKCWLLSWIFYNTVNSLLWTTKTNEISRWWRQNYVVNSGGEWPVKRHNPTARNWQPSSLGVSVGEQTSLVIWIKEITHDNTFKNNFALQGFLKTDRFSLELLPLNL